jgi:DNA topoisomerase-1
MSYIAVIVESPAKCSKIEKYLGPGYKCMASYGHFRELNSLKNIDIKNNFKLKFTVSKNKSGNIQKLKSFIEKSDSVIIASDDDREGEAIGWHICDYFKLPTNKTKRIKFNEITETAIKNSVKNYGYLDMNLVRSQQARQCLDLLVGFSITPLLWKQFAYNSKNPLSAGRCQTPALQIIYDNQKDIVKSPGKLIYNTGGIFTNKNIIFKLNNNFTTQTDVNNFLEETVDFNHVFTKDNSKTIEKKPPTPLSTSCLQQLASNLLNYSPKLTMKTCQTLYEAGLITYMRTDSKTYSKEFVDKTTSYIKNKYGHDYIYKDINNLLERKKGKNDTSQNAHEAIRPTDINRNEISKTSKITNQEIRMYKLIYEITLESCMANAVYTSLTSTITAPSNYIYKNINENVVFPGWKMVKGYDKINTLFNHLINMKNNTNINYNKIYSESTMTHLKSHYTEAKLVKKLEKLGIGRPSTFSSLVDKIQTRNYVKRDNIEGKLVNCTDFELIENNLNEIETKKQFGNEKNKLVIQPIGIMVIEFLNKQFNEIFNYEYTKNMENKLDSIANNNMNWFDLCQDNYDLINILLNQVKCEQENNTTGTKVGEIKIDEIHSYIIGKFGPVIKCNENDKITFKRVKKIVDIEKLKNNKLCLEDIIDNENDTINNTQLGIYKDNDIIIKNGKFGYYISYNKTNMTIDKTKYDINNITYDIAIEIIDNYFVNKDKTIIRVLNNVASIRKGKFGDYIYYKTDKMKRPKFITLKNFKDDYVNCDVNVLLDLVK